MEEKELGGASLVLGIVSIVFSVFSAGTLSAVLGIVGIVLGALARKNHPDGIATAGLVCSIIGTILSLLIVIACVGCTGGLAALSNLN